MLFGSLNFKRRFLATVDPTFTIIHYNANYYGRARKRMRIEEPTSIHGIGQYNAQGSYAAAHRRAETLPQEAEKQGELEGEELEAKLKKSDETCSRVKKKAEHARAQVNKLLQHNLHCMICHDMIQSPQNLDCGHSACYRCVRRWWTKPPTENDDAPMIDTEAESDLEEAPGTDTPNLIEPAPAPRPRRRHRFSSAVNRAKHCPYCNKVIKSRPTTNYRICKALEAMNDELLAFPPDFRARKDSCRADLWHGMFHPALESFREPVPEYVRVAEEDLDLAARERVRAQTIAEGREAGAVEARTEWMRLNQARRVAIVPTLEQLDFWRGNPPHAA